MPLPELKTSEGTVEQRIQRRIVDMAFGVIMSREDLPPQVCVLAKDGETKIIGATVITIERAEANGIYNVAINQNEARVLPLGKTVPDIVNLLTGENPGIPMICDQEILREFADGSLQRVGEGHCRLEAPSGLLDIYTPPDNLAYSKLFSAGTD